MDQLITIIGNASVDPVFRKRFLANPVDTVDHYGFLLTKGDFEMMKTMFTLMPGEKEEVEKAFSLLEDKLYAKLPCQHPCQMSVIPPAEFRGKPPRAAGEPESKIPVAKKQGTGL